MPLLTHIILNSHTLVVLKYGLLHKVLYGYQHDGCQLLMIQGVRPVNRILTLLASTLGLATVAIAYNYKASYGDPSADTLNSFDTAFYLRPTPDSTAVATKSLLSTAATGSSLGPAENEVKSTADPQADAASGKSSFVVGVNLDGYAYNGTMRTARIGYNYVTPSAADIAYFASKGLRLVRLSMAWERLQPVAGGPLDPMQINILNSVLADADKYGVGIIADLHNYGRYDNQIATQAALADFWDKFAAAFKGRFAGYGLMNEPHDMINGTLWPAMAQAAATSIRRVDTSTRLYVAADNWSSVRSTITKIYDPANKTSYEGHLYFDEYSTGYYPLGYKAQSVTSITNQIAAFAIAARSAGGEPYIGEMGWPSDSASMTLGEAAMDAAAKNNVSVTYFLAGPWVNDVRSVQPAGGTDKPQMKVLTKVR